jgi:hypothetical protein
MTAAKNSLDPTTFALEPGEIHWRFWRTDRLGQFDIAIPSDAEFNPDAAALAHLDRALARIDALYDIALPEAEKGWAARYNGPLRPRDAWSIIRLFAEPSGHLVISLNEGEFDTYCLWDVTLEDDKPAGVVHRAWSATAK